MDSLWPLLVIALLGAYHGLNPAMGWLFAVVLGMQEGDRRAVLRALPPIALGHEAAVALAAADRGDVVTGVHGGQQVLVDGRGRHHGEPVQHAQLVGERDGVGDPSRGHGVVSPEVVPGQLLGEDQ